MKPILVHVHVFYKELWPQILTYLKSLEGYPYELYISTVKGDGEFLEVLKEIPSKSIMVLDNLGYDILPFFKVLEQVNLDDYSYVIKIHTKRDIPVRESFFWFRGARWREALLDFLKTPQTFQRTIEAFENEPRLGMHGGAITIYNAFCDGHDSYCAVRDFMTSHALTLKKYHFVAGSIFMVRSQLLKAVQTFALKDSDFVIPKDEHDTFLLPHVLERVLGCAVYAQDYWIKDTQKNAFICAGISWLMNLSKIIMTYILTVRITKSNKLLIKFLKIPVFALKLKE